jgi:hypothetical protein
MVLVLFVIFNWLAGGCSSANTGLLLNCNYTVLVTLVVCGRWLLGLRCRCSLHDFYLSLVVAHVVTLYLKLFLYEIAGCFLYN